MEKFSYGRDAMTILGELTEYAKGCINGSIVSGKKHIWACKRFLRDLDRVGNEDFPYVWNEEEAGKIVRWFFYLRHSKGELAGQPIRLIAPQKFSLCQIYGWRHKETGKKRFTKSFKEVARKNAKTQEEAGVVLYEMSTQAVKNKEIYETYCAGTKKKQSELVFKECINMLNGSPLKSKFRILRNSIVHIKSGSFLEALSKEDGKTGDGTNPALLVLDEYHQHKTTEFYDLGLGANTKESLLMIITTAGVDLNVPCFTQEYEYCSNILNPDVDVENDEYFVDIFEIDESDDIGCEKNWEKANPVRMSYPEGVDKIRKEYEIAKSVPEKMTAFLTKCLNRWVQAANNGYMDMAKWKKCEVKKIPYDLKGRTVFVGFDMSSKIDLTSVAFILPVFDMGKKKYVLYSHSFVPNEEKLRERELKDKAPYLAWARGGYITITGTEIVDQQQVMDYVLSFCQKNRWEIDCLCFDPANASKLMMDLSNEGHTVEEVFQSYKSLNESTAGFREQVYEGNVIYEKNPVLNFAMHNAVTRTNNGLIKIDKDAVKQKIDPVDAVLCAFKLALYYEDYQKTDVDEWLKQDW